MPFYVDEENRQDWTPNEDKPGLHVGRRNQTEQRRNMIAVVARVLELYKKGITKEEERDLALEQNAKSCGVPVETLKAQAERYLQLQEDTKDQILAQEERIETILDQVVKEFGDLEGNEGDENGTIS